MKRAGLLLIGVLALVAQSASAQQEAALQEYDVELIIFRTLSSNATPELWAMEAMAAGQRLEIPDEDPTPFSSRDAGTAASSPSFPAVPPSRLQLTALADALRRSRGYQSLAHFGWTQPGYARNEARYIPIEALAPAVPGLSGQIALSRGRYLHLTLDLAFEEALVAGEPANRYVMRQTRRMRSGERHYIDHPKFGVIALITPVKEQ